MTGTVVGVVDYGLGNLFSVQRAILKVGGIPQLVSTPEALASSPRLILPGVGAFGDGMAGLSRHGLDEAIRSYAKTGRPLLGVCLGMQLLMDRGHEFGVHQGLGVVPGEVVVIPPATPGPGAYKVPHVGWTALEPAGDPVRSWDNTLLAGLAAGAEVYFVHGFMVQTALARHALARTVYGGHRFCSVLSVDNVHGTQFHPERSGRIGLQILKNFLTLDSPAPRRPGSP